MSKKKQMFAVIGVMDTGSGTLTWMEDFDLVGVYDNEKDAQKDCDERNDTIKSEEEVNEDEDDEEYDDEDELTEEMKYEVYPLDVLKK